MGPFSNNTPKSTFLISIPYVNIDPSPIKMVPGPNTVIYAKRHNIDFIFKSMSHKQSEFSDVQNISMLILKKVANGISNTMAGVSRPNSIVCGKAVFRSFNKWAIRCYIFIAGLNIVSYKCGLLQTSPLKNIASSQYIKTRNKK